MEPARLDRSADRLAYLRHVDESLGQGLVAEHRAIFIPFPSLQQYQQLVPVPLQEMRILQGELELELGVQHAAGRDRHLVRAQRPLRAVHLHGDADGR